MTPQPFTIRVPDAVLDDLRTRLSRVRWPDEIVGEPWRYGTDLAYMSSLVEYWRERYDWRAQETELNRLRQFTVPLGGIDLHFVHEPGVGPHPMPLLLSHGWPGSIVEFLEAVGPLTDPTAHGGNSEDAFDLVLPSIPGYGFSGEPRELGWGPARVAQAWAELMQRLGYSHYVAQGGDVGASITDAMGRQAPKGLVGIHTNLLVTGLGGGEHPSGTEEEKAALAALATFRASGFGYFLEQATRPQTIGYALLDSPVALAAWLLDHDTDSYYKISHAFVDGRPAGNLTRDHILDNITVYWLTRTGASAARSYWESGQAQAAAQASGQAPPEASLPVGFTQFPDEIFRAPQSWVEQSYPNVIYFHKADKGGHFAAWEEPEIFTTEIRAAFRPLRNGASS